LEKLNRGYTSGSRGARRVLPPTPPNRLDPLVYPLSFKTMSYLLWLVHFIKIIKDLQDFWSSDIYTCLKLAIHVIRCVKSNVVAVTSCFAPQVIWLSEQWQRRLQCRSTAHVLLLWLQAADRMVCVYSSSYMYSTAI